MCGRFYVPEDASIQMIRAIVERLEHRNVKVETGDVFPGDMAAVVASNRQLQPQPFAMEWGYHLPDGKRIINARSETASQKAMFVDGIRQRRCLIPAQHYYECQSRVKKFKKHSRSNGCENMKEQTRSRTHKRSTLNVKPIIYPMKERFYWLASGADSC